MKLIITTISLILAFSSVIFAQQIDTKASKITFEITNMKVNTVEGTFTGMKGTVKFNSSDLSNSNFDVCIDAASVDTKNKKRDDHLRTEDFFDVEKHPTICFKSSEIIKTKEGYLTKGKLTMHGVTKTVDIPFTYANETLTGKLNLNRFDYKVGEDTNTFMVDDEVELTIICKLL